MAGVTPRCSRRYPARVPRLAAIVLALPLVLPPGPVFAQDSSEILHETARTYRAGRRLVQMWWLPVDYWVAAARERKKTPAEIDEIQQLFRNYTLIGALDADLRPDGSHDALSTAEIVRRMEVEIDGHPQQVMRQVDERLQELAPELSYVLRLSLVNLGSGLHILPLPNLREDGRLVLRSSEPGKLRVRYRAVPDVDPVEFWWHTPLTSIAGAKRCKSGERAEASWQYCPWDGSKVD